MSLPGPVKTCSVFFFDVVEDPAVIIDMAGDFSSCRVLEDNGLSAALLEYDKPLSVFKSMTVDHGFFLELGMFSKKLEKFFCNGFGVSVILVTTFCVQVCVPTRFSTVRQCFDVFQSAFEVILVDVGQLATALGDLLFDCVIDESFGGFIGIDLICFAEGADVV